MKKQNIILITLCVFVLCVGLCLGYFIKGCCPQMAVVDVLSVVNASTQVQTLKAEQNIKTQDLVQWLQKAQEEVKAEEDEKARAALLQKYNAEFAQKKAEIVTYYQQELKSADEAITGTIKKVAKEKGYKAVIAKGVMIYGGDDITEDVIKVIK